MFKHVMDSILFKTFCRRKFRVVCMKGGYLTHVSLNSAVTIHLVTVVHLQDVTNTKPRWNRFLWRTPHLNHMLASFQMKLIQPRCIMWFCYFYRVSKGLNSWQTAELRLGNENLRGTKGNFKAFQYTAPWNMFVFFCSEEFVFTLLSFLLIVAVTCGKVNWSRNEAVLKQNSHVL